MANQRSEKPYYSEPFVVKFSKFDPRRAIVSRARRTSARAHSVQLKVHRKITRVEIPRSNSRRFLE